MPRIHISYIVAPSIEAARREARWTYSRNTFDTRAEAEEAARKINAEHGYDGHYKVYRESIQPEVAA